MPRKTINNTFGANNFITDLFDTAILSNYRAFAVFPDSPVMFYDGKGADNFGGPIDKDELFEDMDSLGMDLKQCQEFTYFHHTPNEFVHKFYIDVTLKSGPLVYARHIQTLLKTEISTEEVP